MAFVESLDPTSPEGQAVRRRLEELRDSLEDNLVAFARFLYDPENCWLRPRLVDYLLGLGLVEALPSRGTQCQLPDATVAYLVARGLSLDPEKQWELRVPDKIRGLAREFMFEHTRAQDEARAKKRPKAKKPQNPRFALAPTAGSQRGRVESHFPSRQELAQARVTATAARYGVPLDVTDDEEPDDEIAEAAAMPPKNGRKAVNGTRKNGARTPRKAKNA